MIKVEHLTKSFGNIKAVDDLSFEVHKGEVVGFLGPNGAGKTTTMRLISGFYSPDEGEVVVADIPVAERATEAQKHIGYMPENNPLYKDMLVSEFLDLSADLKGIAKSQKHSALDFVVKAVAIGDIFYRPIKELSKGYKQRVGIAAALIHKPRILIMDEPTEGLDPNQRTEIRQLVKNLAKDHTIIMSTHVMQEAQAVCSRLIVISRGKLVADGTTEELSKAVRKERVILLDVEGNGVELELRNLSGVEHIDFEQAQSGRVKARLMASKSVELQPEISRIARERSWTIWRLQEEEHKLEDIFHKLTSEV
jgi:ABC-2 type transport system ATP-binding protein